jgi:hypothetical protein
MTLNSHIDNNNQIQEVNTQESFREIQNEKILCPHCKRTSSNGIKCKGICVSDSDY